MKRTSTSTSASGSRAKLLAGTLAAALLAAPLAAAGFPVIDVPATAQRVLDAIEQKIIAAQTTITASAAVQQVAQIATQIQQGREAAEGLIGRVTGWPRMIASTATMLGSPGDLSAWLQSTQNLRARAERIENGTEALAPTPAEARGVWGSRPAFPPLGSTPPITPPVSRAEIAERRSQAVDDNTAALDDRLKRRAEALERSAQALDEAKQAAEQAKASTETSGTALQQTQRALTGTVADLLTSQEQREALREEREIAELAAQRAGLAQLRTQTLAGIDRLFAEAAALQGRYDAAGADLAFARPVLPSY